MTTTADLPAEDGSADPPRATPGSESPSDLSLLERDLRSVADPAPATHDPVDVLVVCAVAVEAEALVARFGATPARDSHDVRRLRTHVAAVDSRPGPLRVGILRTAGAGGLLTTGHVLRALGDLDPQWVLLVGIAAGHPEGEIMDLLVADSVAAVTYTRVGRDGREHLRGSYTPDKELVGRLLEYLSDDHPEPVTVRTGPLISSDNRVHDAALRDELLALGPGGVGLEMEAGPVGDCLEGRGTPWAVLKAVVDHADADATKEHQAAASALVADVVHGFLAAGHLAPRRRVARMAGLPSRMVQLSESAKRRLRADFVVPPDVGALLDRLRAEGHLILAGSAGAGVPTLARFLLAATTEEVVVVDDRAALRDIPLPSDLEGWGITGRCERRTLDEVRAFAERVRGAGGLCTFVVDDEHVTGPDVHRVAPMDHDRLERAVRVRVAMVCPDLDEPGLEVVMEAARPVLAAATPSTDALHRLGRIISDTVAELGVAGTTTETLQQRTSDVVVDRWTALEGGRAQAWFVAGLVLDGSPRRAFSRAADRLESELAGERGEDVPEEPRASVTEVLAAAGLVTTDDGRIRAQGVVPELALPHLVDEFPHVRDGLLRWMAGVVDAEGGHLLEGLPTALCALVGAGLEPEALAVVERWLGRISVTSVAQADRALAAVVDAGGIPQLVQHVVSGWIEDPSSPARLTAPLLLGLETGRALPTLASRFVLWTTHRIQAGQPIGPTDRWAVQLIYEDEVVGPAVIDHVIARAVAAEEADDARAPGRVGAALVALDLIDFKARRHRHLFRDRERRHAMARAIGHLLSRGNRRRAATALLRKWAGRAGDDPQLQRIFNAIVEAVRRQVPGARPYLDGTLAHVRAGTRDMTWVRG